MLQSTDDPYCVTCLHSPCGHCTPRFPARPGWRHRDALGIAHPDLVPLCVLLPRPITASALAPSPFPVCCLVAKSCLTLRDPTDCRTPDFPVPHRLPEFARVHIHCIGHALWLSHPLLPSSPPPSVFPFRFHVYWGWSYTTSKDSRSWQDLLWNTALLQSLSTFCAPQN